LLPVYNELKNCPELNLFFYEDIYNAGYNFLEIANCNASKFHAANKLRSILQADKLVGFGDNMNDLPLLKACDEFYAVENAHPEIKKIAAKTIDTNTNCGVINFLESRYL
jgi:hydroxymethylpyrimidine pyrophosphatase-like HAD family hydrolase